jgi:hypothetical protein
MSTMTGIAAKQTTPGGNPKKGTEEKAKKIANTISKRMHGINKATSRLAKEEVELNEETEQLQEYESKGGTYQHKGNYGTSYKTDEEGNEIKPAKQKGYGARQNYVRGTSTGEKKKMKEELSFTEMLELYNEHGLKVLAPIEKEEQQIGDQTVEVIDADKVNGVVATIVEEPTEEEFNKELKDQQDSFAGKKKQPKVAAGKTTGVKVMPEEVELDERTLTSGEAKKKEEYVKGMKKGLSGFKQRYGERAKSVMYATATKMAKKD